MHLKWAFSGALVQRIISKVYRSYHETRSELLRIKKKQQKLDERVDLQENKCCCENSWGLGKLQLDVLNNPTSSTNSFNIKIMDNFEQVHVLAKQKRSSGVFILSHVL